MALDDAEESDTTHQRHLNGGAGGEGKTHRNKKKKNDTGKFHPQKGNKSLCIQVAALNALRVQFGAKVSSQEVLGSIGNIQEKVGMITP